jgi:serine/threonine-protein kinase
VGLALVNSSKKSARGHGVVYRARYVKDDRQFAIKLLPSQVKGERHLSRFEREMDVLKTLRHPNIVRSFGGVCENKRRFYAMELVNGGTFDDILSEKAPLPWELTVEYALQICSALAYAHDRGVVHRDIKPGNFLLTEEGRLKLSDFGLVSIVAAAKITATGKTMGTVRYMAPEQIRGTEVSPAIDLYALRCMLFEILTGSPPFDGDSPANVMHMHLKTTAPRVAASVPGCPAALDQLVSQLLSKKSADRPASALAVAKTLKGISQTTLVGSISVIPPAGTTIDAETIDDSDVDSPTISGTSDSRLKTAIAVIDVLGVISLWLAFGRGNSGRAAELWLKALESEHVQERVAATEAVGNLETTDRATVDLLIDRLDDESADVRAAAAHTLGDLGFVARPAIPTLVKLQKQDESTVVRTQAAESLETVRRSKPGSSILPWILVGELIAGGWFAWKKISRIASATTRA